MIPYHHYPRVGLNYCRCGNCGNDMRSIMLSRIFDRRIKNIPYKPMPKYKARRLRRFILNKPTRPLARRDHPPYKQRRVHRLAMQKLLKEFGAE